ncbi:MAG: hypothetical protein EU541_05040 [Promethearchaeota archaeon]|nr:MAG: hypothetical protein EU541_05040 [Candidatus Lokiarchaeota archaeon]
MEAISIEILENLSIENIGKNINSIFSDLLKIIEIYLGLPPVYSRVNVRFLREKSNKNLKRNNILDLGVKRNFENELLEVEIFDEYEKYLPFILLREAFYCFIPKNLVKNEGIKIIINQIVEINLKKIETIEEWKQLVRDFIVDYSFLAAEFDKLEKFLKLKGEKKSEKPIKLFFNYIRKNVFLISEDSGDLHHDVLKEFIRKTSISLNSDEMVETIRVLIKIFYNVKSYRALLDYQNYFKEFIKNGEIITDLSLRKFTSNLRWINKFSYIAPSYQVNLNSINAGVLFCKLSFNPILEKWKIDQVIEELPFFYMSKSSESSFIIEVTGWFVFPLAYEEDITNYIKRLQENGYIIKNTYFLRDNFKNVLNLNYFREFYKKGRIINPKHKKYDDSYIISFEMENRKNSESYNISLLEYVILNRIGYWSIDGFSFERRLETVRTIKNDTFYEILSQKKSLKNFKKNINAIISDPELRDQFLYMLKQNKNLGFFYIKNFLNNFLLSLKLIRKILKKNPGMKTNHQFKELIVKRNFIQSIEKNIIFKNKDIRNTINQDYLSIYLKDKNKIVFDINKYRLFIKFVENCLKLKIINVRKIMKIIEDENIVDKIISKKIEKVEELSQETSGIQNLTSNKIENFLEDLTTGKSPLLKPILINTINTSSFARYFIQVIIRQTKRTENKIFLLEKFLPRIVQDSGTNTLNNENLKMIQIFIPTLNEKEKRLFTSILYNLFGDDLISIKRFFYNGFLKSIILRNFYDLNDQQFFYTKDLFNEYFLYTKKILGKELSNFKEIKTKDQNTFWSSNKDIHSLVELVEDRKSREQIDFNINNINDLISFFQNLKNILLDLERFKEMKNRDFFKKYIKSIKFKPSLNDLGLGQYYLYVRPIDSNEIDLKLLLTNTFQKIKFPAYIDDVTSLFIKYIFPHRNPNLSYINWLTKSKKIISEYCIFTIKTFYQLLHFNFNIGSNGWELEPSRFKSYMQRVLFDSEFRKKISKPIKYNFKNLSNSRNQGKNSVTFKYLDKIYNLKSIDLKSVMGTRNYALIEKIKYLLNENLIQPYLKLKNLDFKDKLLIVLPDVEKKVIPLLIKVFKYFNYGFLYEIEGEYFIYGFDNQKKFENGLMIKLYLPYTEISEFQKIFNQLFQYLNIKKYLILSDMIEGKNLIKSVYGDLSFLESYDPLKNLIWNDKDKIWMNHKLFNENFQPIYPDLVLNE